MIVIYCTVVIADVSIVLGINFEVQVWCVIIKFSINADFDNVKRWKLTGQSIFMLNCIRPRSKFYLSNFFSKADISGAIYSLISMTTSATAKKLISKTRPLLGVLALTGVYVLAGLFFGVA